MGTFQLLKTTYAVPGSSVINAIAIAPDDQDLGRRQAFSATTSSMAFTAWSRGSPSRPPPNNIAISPDGQTVLVANIYNNSVSAFSISGPGVLAGNSDTLGGLPSNPQSIAFSPGGGTAYVDSTTYCPRRDLVAERHGAGNHRPAGRGAVTLSSSCGQTSYGVDGMASRPDGRSCLWATQENELSEPRLPPPSFSVTNLRRGLPGLGVATFMPLNGTTANPYGLHFKDELRHSGMSEHERDPGPVEVLRARG